MFNLLYISRDGKILWIIQKFSLFINKTGNNYFFEVGPTVITLCRDLVTKV